MITYYDLLGVPVDADAGELQRAYHRKAQLLHPDRHVAASEPVQREAESAMKTVNEAWNSLKDPESRHQYDVDNGLLDDDGLPLEDVPRAGWERPVAADECELCGSAPAVAVVIRQETGKIIWRTRRRMEGTFCRECGLALFRSMQNRTLITGWWGVLSFFVNIGSVLGNLAAWWKIRSVATPRRDPAVVSYLQSPLDSGAPLYRRAGVWFAAIVLIVVGSAAASEASQQDDYSTPSYSSPSGGSGYTSLPNTWTESDKSVMRSAGTKAGMSYSDADCIVRYLTTRYSPSDNIPDYAFDNAGNYCL
jgi:DnaJ-like protein